MPDQNNNNANQNNNQNDNSGTITVTGKPSTSQSAKFYKYKEYTKTWKNYCPLCGKSGKLSDNPKGVPEGEITCDKSKGGCDADYDICTGGDKSGKYRAYLQDANGRSNTKDSVDTSIGGGEGGPQQSTESTGSSVGSAVQINDQTFYGLIKQMMGATDSVFITANNMAYLLSYVDLHKYRSEYKDYIPQIKADHILKDSIVQYWTTEGVYNTVEVTYKDGTLKYQHDLLVQQYGEQTYYFELQDDDEETAKAKAQALLSAHVRDYSLDLQLNCLYNPHITVGSWIKIPKKVIKVDNKEHTENKKQKTKRKCVDITNITEKVQEEQNGQQTIIQTITTKDKKKIEVRNEKIDYEFYFVQGYKYWWTPDHAPIMNVHLKYGPDTPEDPINATIGVGGGSSSTVSAEGVSEQIKQLVASIIGNETDTLAKAQLVHNWLASELTYSRYDCMRQSSPDACLESKHINCADTSQLTWAMMTAAGVEAVVVHAPGHFWTVLKINGQEYASDCTGKNRPFNEVASGWKSKWESKSYTECGSKPSC